MLRRRPLNIRDILRWAEAYRLATGRWPTRASGGIAGTIGETWARVDHPLREGLRTLPGGSSLARLLAEHCGARNVQNLPRLTERQILAWADDHHRRTGAWPTAASGTIPNTGGEKWSAINAALQAGTRSLPGGSSLARLLAEHRGVRNRKNLPQLTEEQILAWADAHFRRTGAWPTSSSGPVVDAPGETWMAVEMALSHGQRRLPGGSSLAKLLAARRAVRHHGNVPRLSIAQILAWADAFHAQTGRWPRSNSGPVAGAPGETWAAIDSALKAGRRDLPGGSSLARLLARERGVRAACNLPPLTHKQILQWADAHHRRTGRWPTRDSGPIPEAPGETWRMVDEALRRGHRRLRGGSSLAQLLAERRPKRHHQRQPPPTKRQILAWADAHRRRTGAWPNVNSGAVHDAPGERWDLIDNALRQGSRGQPCGSSLARLLARHREVRNPARLPVLTEAQILRWAAQHHRRTGSWPVYKSGAVADAPGETWAGLDHALRYGRRGLPGRSSLARLLAHHRSRTDGGQNGVGI